MGRTLHDIWYVENPEETVAWLIGHRLKREKKVIGGLKQLGTADLDALVKVVYDDVDESIHHMAKLSLTAHLIKLEQEHRAGRNVDDEWTLTSA